MGVSVVRHELRPLDTVEPWELGIDERDVAHAKIHHSYNPSENYCEVEFRMPTIEKQMPSKHLEEIIDTKYYSHLHRMKFNKVENMAFHGYMDKEGRSTIDKIRYYEGTKLITYYFSSTRRLGLLPHDYTMAMLVYLNYPERFFTRRTPCKKIDPRCVPGCYEVLAESIVTWLDDPEPNTARLDKYFFAYVGEHHRLCLGYTIEHIKSNDTCFEPIEPEYYTLDLNAKYFREAIWSKFEWENKILEERRELDEEMFVIYDTGPDTLSNGDDLEQRTVQFGGWGGAASLARYNYKKDENVPNQLHLAITQNNFAELWRFDMASINSRNSIHKWTYNEWVEFLNNDETGWWCAWDASETISSAGDTAAGLGDGSGQVESQLNQVANTVGWGVSGDMSSSDTEYNQIYPKYNGYTYETYTEPLPERGSSLF